MQGVLGAGLLVVASWLAAVTYVHRRGRVRHGLMRQFTDHSAVLAPYNVLMYALSAVPRRPILDSRDFPDLAPLREHWREIRDEAQQLYALQELRPAVGWNDIAFNTFFKRGWKRFYLKWYGEPLPSARALCPKTVELVESIPGIHAALFTLLPPGGRLGEHRDPFAGSLRYHLGLTTPNSPDCRIWVDGTPYAWRDGEDVVFDETYIHSARNDTDTTRIILFCDVERPLRTSAARRLNRFVAEHMVRISAGQNAAGEPLGFLNHLAPKIYEAKEFFRTVRKRVGRRTFYGVKYALIAAGLLLMAVAVVRAFVPAGTSEPQAAAERSR